MPNLVYLDNSNFWIAGNAAIQKRRPRARMRLDYKHLLNMLSMGETPRVAKVYGSQGDKHRNWNDVTDAGFELSLFKRSPSNTEKEVDTALVTDLVADALTLYRPGDMVVLIAGDRDYVPAIERLKKAGIPVYVAFWDQQISDKLKKSAAQFVCLDDHFDALCKPATFAPLHETALVAGKVRSMLQRKAPVEPEPKKKAKDSKMHHKHAARFVRHPGQGMRMV